MKKNFIVAIEASNINQGGGVTHLTQMLAALDIKNTNIEKVLVWVPRHTVGRYPVRPWLIVKSPFWINAHPFIRFFVQLTIFPFLARMASCDIIFSPGGIVSFFRVLPVVAMSQNMLPFEAVELDRFGLFSKMWFKLRLLRVIQSFSFKRADGVIFLTQYARSGVSKFLTPFSAESVVVPHGVESRFFIKDRVPRRLEDISKENPLRLLYVSIAMPYKHQIEVASAVKIVRDRGVPVQIEFVGPQWAWYYRDLMAHINKLDPNSKFIKWVGEVAFDRLHEVYSGADAFIFASSCENMPNILIEAMGSGLPIASSRLGPMPEVLGGGGLYFDPLVPESIADAIEKIAKNPDLMLEKSREAVSKARAFSWSSCGQNTFDFIGRVAASRCTSNSA